MPRTAPVWVARCPTAAYKPHSDPSRRERGILVPWGMQSADTLWACLMDTDSFDFSASATDPLLKNTRIVSVLLPTFSTIAYCRDVKFTGGSWAKSWLLGILLGPIQPEPGSSSAGRRSDGHCSSDPIVAAGKVAVGQAANAVVKPCSGGGPGAHWWPFAPGPFGPYILWYAPPTADHASKFPVLLSPDELDGATPWTRLLTPLALGFENSSKKRKIWVQRWGSSPHFQLSGECPKH